MNKILVLFIFFFFTFCLNVHGMCVIEGIEASGFRGVVVTADSGYVVKNAEIQIFKGKTQKKPIKTLNADSNGYFEIIGLPKGKHEVRVSSPAAVPLFIQLTVNSKKPEKYLTVKLGYLIGEPCGGGDVESTE